jgi:hypothetical protein
MLTLHQPHPVRRHESSRAEGGGHRRLLHPQREVHCEP